MSTFVTVVASLGGAGGLGAGAKAALSWLSREARREGKLDQILAQLTAIAADHETRLRVLEQAGPK